MRLVDKVGIKLEKWGVDRWLHVVIACVISWFFATVVSTVVVLLGYHPQRVLMGLVGLVCGWLFCVCKEIYDKKTTDIFDEVDLAAGFVGVALFFIIYSV